MRHDGELYFSLIGCVHYRSDEYSVVPTYGTSLLPGLPLPDMGSLLLLSYWIGQKKYPIHYDLKSIGLYVLLAAVLYVIGEQVPISNLVLRLAFRTILLLLFVSYNCQAGSAFEPDSCY